MALVLGMLSKIFTRQHIEMVFLFFPKKQDLTFHANCLIGDNLHKVSNPVFLRKIRKNIMNLSSVEFVQRVVKVSLHKYKSANETCCRKTNPFGMCKQLRTRLTCIFTLVLNKRGVQTNTVFSLIRLSYTMVRAHVWCIIARTRAEPWYNWLITFTCM